MSTLVITGHAARELRTHVLIYGRTGPGWQEAQGMSECRHGCKLYVRRQGCILRFALIHSRSYGCTIDPTPVPVTVRVSPRRKG